MHPGPVNFEKSNLFPVNLPCVQVPCSVPWQVPRSRWSILRKKKLCPEPGSLPCEPGRQAKVLSTFKNQNWPLWTFRVSKYPVGTLGKFLGLGGEFWKKKKFVQSQDLFPVNRVDGPRSCKLWKIKLGTLYDFQKPPMIFLPNLHTLYGY